MNIIERPYYLNQLNSWREKKVIKVITGVRRCGKSTLMQLFQQQLLNSGVDAAQIIAINFEDLDYYDLREPQKLHSYIKERLRKEVCNYIFLDEVQLVADFHQVADSLYIKENVDLYLTGSNAMMLSGELATLLSGRYVEIKMTPLSFKEYVGATGDTSDLSRKYNDYISSSSFPYALDLAENRWQLNEYLNGIYSTIVLKDIMQRYRISDGMMLESVVRFAADNIGNTLSSKSIADTLSSNGRKIDVKTVEKFLSALVECFMLYRVKRYDVKGKSLLKTMEKYYFVDIGLRRTLLGTRGFDVGRILENVVYMELQRRFPEVYIGKVNQLEVDFIARSTDKVYYFQVAATVREEQTLRRELAPLQAIPDHYTKIILSLDDDPDADYDGILRTNVLKWLVFS